MLKPTPTPIRTISHSSLVEVSIKCLYEKQCHPQNIEDARYNTHNDDVVTVQNRYNLADRASEYMTAAESEAMIDICARQSIGFIPCFPLATGELARQGGQLDQIARRHNAKPSQIALAWLLQRSSTMLPIPGTSSVKHLEENVLGATIKLTREKFDALDQISKQ